MESMATLINKGLEHINCYLGSIQTQNHHQNFSSHGDGAIANQSQLSLPLPLLKALQLAHVLLESTTWNDDKKEETTELLLTRLMPLAHCLQLRRYDLAGVALSHACLYLAEKKCLIKALTQTWLKLNTAFLQRLRASEPPNDPQEQELYERIMVSESDHRLTLLHDYLKEKTINLPQWQAVDRKLFERYLRLEKASHDITEINVYHAEITRLEHQFILGLMNQRFSSVAEAPSSLLDYVPQFEWLVERCFLMHEKESAYAVVRRFKAWAKTPEEDAALLQLLLRLHQMHWQSAEREPYWHAYRRQLKAARQILQHQASVPPAERYQQHVQYSRAVHALLKAMLTAGVELLALSTLPFTVVLFGSAARHELLPYSDIEGVILISDADTKKRLQPLLQWWQWQMDALNESDEDGSGLQFDNSFSPLKQLLTPEELAARCSLDSDVIQSGFALSNLQTKYLYGDEDLYAAFAHAREQRLAVQVILGEHTPNVLAPGDNPSGSRNPTTPTRKLQINAREFFKDPAWQTPFPGVEPKLVIDRPLHQVLATLAYANQPAVFERHRKEAPGHINLKDSVIKPLLYASMDIALALSWIPFPPPPAVFNRLAQHYPAWASFAHLLEQAYYAVQALRTNLHFQYQHQVDTLAPSTPLSLPAFTLDALHCWQDSLFPALYKQLNSVFSQTPLTFVQEIIDPVLTKLCRNEGITSLSSAPRWQLLLQLTVAWHLPAHVQAPYYQALTEEEKEAYLDALETAGCPIDDVARLPNPAGNRQRERLVQRAFQRALDGITLPKDTPLDATWPREVDVTLHFPNETTERRLHPLIADTLIDKTTGNIIKQFQGRHPVAAIDYGGYVLHIKQKPDHPMMDYAIFLFKHRLCGHSAVPNTLAKLTVTDQHGNKNSYPVLLAASIGTLADNIAHIDASELQQCRVAPSAFTSAVLADLMLRPGDGALRNYQRTAFPPPNGEDITFVCIDNDQHFFEPLVETKEGRKLRLRSLWLCMDQMNDALDRDTLEAFCQLNPHAFLYQWLQKIIKQNKLYKALYNKIFALSKLTAPEFERLKTLVEAHDPQFKPFNAQPLADHTKIAFKKAEMILLKKILHQLGTPEAKTLSAKLVEEKEWQIHYQADAVGNRFVPHFLLKEGCIAQLALDMVFLQGIIRTALKLNEPLSGATLLEKFNIRLYRYYAAFFNPSMSFAFSKLSAPEFERLKILTENYYPKFKRFNAQPLANYIQIAVEKAEVALLKETLHRLGTPEAKTLSAKLVSSLSLDERFRGVTQQSIVSASSSQTLQAMLGQVPSAQAIDDEEEGKFSPAQSIKELGVIDPSLFSNEVVISNDNRIVQANFAHLCLTLHDGRKIPDGRRQRVILQSLLYPTYHYEKLILQSASALDDTLLLALLQQSPELKYLDIRDAMNVSEAAIRRLPDLCPKLQALYLSGNPKFINLAASNFTDTPLVLNDLQRLHLGRCTQLQRLSLEAPQLHTLKLNGCSRFIPSALKGHFPALTVLDMRNHPALIDSDLPRMLVSVTALQQLRLTGCPKVRERTHWEKYPLLATVDWRDKPWLSLLVQCWNELNHPLPVMAIAPLRLMLLQQQQGCQQALAILLKLTKDKDREVQVAACKALGQLGQTSGPVIQVLINACQDNNWYVCCTAIHALGQLGQTSEPVIQALLAACGDKHKYIRQAACKASGQLGQTSEHVIQALLAACRDKNEHVRQAACEALGQLGLASEPVLEALLNGLLLRGEEEDVGKAAIKALVQLGQTSEPVIQALIKACRDKDYNFRQAVYQALVQLGQQTSEPVLEALLNACRDKKNFVRYTAIEALGQLGLATSSVMQTLLHACQDDCGDVRQAAYQALGQLGLASEPVLEALLNACKDNGWPTAIQALGQLGLASEPVLEALLNACKDNNCHAREAACKALGQLGHPSESTTQALINACWDKDEYVRKAACYALGQLGHSSEPAIQMLINACRDKDEHVRKAACYALGQLVQTSEPVIQALIIHACRDGDSRVRQAAYQALGQLAHQASESVIQVLLEACQNYDSDACETACYALGQLGQASEPVIQALINACRDEDSYSVRGAACKALGQLGQTSEPVIQALINACRDEDSYSVRGAACKALGQLGQISESVIQALLNACRDKDSHSVRGVACKALGQLAQASEHVIQALITACEDNYIYVRQAAIHILGQLGRTSEPAIQALINAHFDKDSDVRKAAYQSLGQLGQTSEPVIQALITACRDKDSYFVRHAAIQALGNTLSFTSLIDRSEQLIKQSIAETSKAVPAVSLSSMNTSGALPGSSDMAAPRVPSIATPHTFFAHHQANVASHTANALSTDAKERKTTFDPNNNNHSFI